MGDCSSGVAGILIKIKALEFHSSWIRQRKLCRRATLMYWVCAVPRRFLLLKTSWNLSKESKKFQSSFHHELSLLSMTLLSFRNFKLVKLFSQISSSCFHFDYLVCYSICRKVSATRLLTQLSNWLKFLMCLTLYFFV